MRKMIPEISRSFSSYFVTFMFGITKQLDIWQHLFVYIRVLLLMMVMFMMLLKI